MSAGMPGAEYLASISYDPETGRFVRVKSSRPHLVGRDAATTNGARGYVRVTVGNDWCYAHRLAWHFVHGKWPTKMIDHINGDTQDNRIANLREATHQQNMCNSRNYGKYLKGVHWFENRFTAQITVHGKKIYLGRFDTEGQAHAAYAEAAKRLHGEFARLS